MTYPTPTDPWHNTSLVPVTTTYTPRVSDAHITVAWIATAFTLGYMLPWAVAATRRKSNSAAIGLLNFFAGWTAVGWLVALVLACTAEPVRGVYMNITPTYQPGALPPPPGWYPDGTGGTRYWDGTRWTTV
ncbi:superinfection immunity protein [Umezawaea endophytica]|uniref:Superinfection immunity protein n=1 Tax=Umezawaea endophytica TaxID=1654476 RepID=A0A9X2VXL2_9PSEU|nr:superinfection immunity protein [Umezawaea endophytica]MCS7484057.1 superinfection immunity protein [Umezawaea endophytica]